MMIPCLCFLRMALTYIVPVRYCMNRGSANGAPAGGAFLVDIPTEAVAEVRGPDELRLLIFPQPLGRALKNQNAAPTTPPCFSRWLRSSSLLFESSRRTVNRSLLLDIPTGWEPRAKQSRTVALLAALCAAALFKSSSPPKKKNQYTLCTGFSWCG